MMIKSGCWRFWGFHVNFPAAGQTNALSRVITRFTGGKGEDGVKGIVICSGEAVSVDGVPEEVKLLPLGHVHSQKGDFLVDGESAELIRKQFKSRKVDLVIDYEHQTLKDVQAPAGGWIEDVYKGEDAIIAKVRWTDKAKEYLKNLEYRYLSPVVITRKSDRKAIALHSAALTNTPAIDGMFALVNSIDMDDFEEDEEDAQMELKKIAELLGLPESATQEDIEKALAVATAAMEANKTDGGKAAEATGETVPVANSVILSMLGLDGKAKTEDVAAAIMTLKAGYPDEDIRALKEELLQRAAEELVQTALKSGKITAAQKEWAVAYALSDKEGFKAFVDKAPVVVPVGKLDTVEKKNPGNAGIDMKILKNCGLTEEDVKKYYREDEECTE